MKNEYDLFNTQRSKVMEWLYSILIFILIASVVALVTGAAIKLWQGIL